MTKQLGHSISQTPYDHTAVIHQTGWRMEEATHPETVLKHHATKVPEPAFPWLWQHTGYTDSNNSQTSSMPLSELALAQSKQ